MNKIEVKKMKSKFLDEEHNCIVIDGKPLDSILHSLHSDGQYEGLIPTIVDWIEESSEKSFVLSRYQSKEKMVMLPILMCSDDCDLWCTLVVTEVIKEDNVMKWNRIGIDLSTREELISSYENIGKRVDWLAHFPSMTFDQAEYSTQINKLIQCNS